MLYGMIEKNKYGNYLIRVDGYPKCMFIYYTKRKTVRTYRQWHNLIRKPIRFIDVGI